MTDPISPATDCRHSACFSNTAVIKPKSEHCKELLASQCSLFCLKNKSCIMKIFCGWRQLVAGENGSLTSMYVRACEQKSLLHELLLHLIVGLKAMHCLCYTVLYQTIDKIYLTWLDFLTNVDETLHVSLSWCAGVHNTNFSLISDQPLRSYHPLFGENSW